jgi:Matrixin/Putative peptidoglycan binding domain
VQPAVAGDVVSVVDSRPTAQGGTFDAATEAALREFQMMANLPQTGTLTAETLAKMSSPRCGNPDVAGFVATGGRWASRNLTYAFQEFTPDLSPADCRQAVHQAFSTWAGWTGLTFREGSLATAEIIIRFVTGNHGDGNNFDGASGILAHAYFPGTPPAAPSPIQGDTHFDDAETWTLIVPPGAGTIDLTTVAIHEFGHALGLNHSPVVGSVMQAFYGGPRRYLHADDMNGITSIYGGYAIAEASWVHGTAVQIEVPEQLESVRRYGFFTRVVGKPNSTNWLHFAIPTPVIENGARRTFGPCMVRFSTGGTNALVRDVHLFDGENRVVMHNGVNLSGSQPFTRFGIAHAPKVLWGVGVTLGVSFGGGDANARTIDLISAGCDFQQ